MTIEVSMPARHSNPTSSNPTSEDRRRLKQMLRDAGCLEHCPTQTTIKFAGCALVGIALYAGAAFVPAGWAIAMLLAASIPIVTAAMVVSADVAAAAR